MAGHKAFVDRSRRDELLARYKVRSRVFDEAARRRSGNEPPADPPPALALAPALTDAVNSQPVNMIPLVLSLAPIPVPPL